MIFLHHWPFCGINQFLVNYKRIYFICLIKIPLIHNPCRLQTFFTIWFCDDFLFVFISKTFSLTISILCCLYAMHQKCFQMCVSVCVLLRLIIGHDVSPLTHKNFCPPLNVYRKFCTTFCKLLRLCVHGYMFGCVYMCIRVSDEFRNWV